MMNLKKRRVNYMKSPYEYEQDKIPFKVYGPIIKRIREYLGWSQNKLAITIGVSGASISALESGTRYWKPSEDFYNLFCTWFNGCDVMSQQELIAEANTVLIQEVIAARSRGKYNHYCELIAHPGRYTSRPLIKDTEQTGPVKVYIEDGIELIKIKKITSDIGDINGYEFILKPDIPCVITVNSSILNIIVKLKEGVTRIFNINGDDVYYKSYFIDVIELVETFNTTWTEQQKKVNSFNYKKYLFKEV